MHPLRITQHKLKTGEVQSHTLYLPREMAKALGDQIGRYRFLPEFTDEGILYRRVDPNENPTLEKPKWA